jgi:cell wall-associated NlpC family hydrolase
MPAACGAGSIDGLQELKIKGHGVSRKINPMTFFRGGCPAQHSNGASSGRYVSDSEEIILHEIRRASPNELNFVVPIASKSSWCFILAVCFCAFLLTATDSSALPPKKGQAPLKASVSKTQPVPPSCAVVKPPVNKAAPQAKVKAPVRKTAKAKPKAVAAANPRKIAVTDRPLISAKTVEKAENITTEIGDALPSDLEREIGKFLGMRYRFGGEGQGGYDCSGLIREVYSNLYGINLPHSSVEQSRLGIMQSVPGDDLKTGDLLFFGGSGRGNRVSHVGMYLAGGYFFHAARSEGVTISRIDESYWKKRHMFSKRVRGLDIGEEDEEEDADLDRALKQYSAAFALGAGEQSEMVSVLDGGIKVNDSLELVLSGFFLNALDDNPQNEDPESLPALQNTVASEPETGFRLAAVISPLEWFKLIPSMTQFDRSGEDDSRDRGFQKLGLETWFMFPYSNLALFMAARADNQNDLFEQPLAVAPNWETVDVALGLHYSLSDSLRFSIWGTRNYSPDQKVTEDPARRGSASDDVSFKLDIRF